MIEEAYATLRIGGGRGRSAEVSRRLGLMPTSSYEVGDRVGRREGTPVRETWLWLLRSTAPGDAVLSYHLEDLLSLVEPVAEGLRALRDEGCWADLFCFVSLADDQGGLTLRAELLSRAGSLGLGLVVDLCGPDGDDLDGGDWVQQPHHRHGGGA